MKSKRVKFLSLMVVLALVFTLGFSGIMSGCKAEEAAAPAEEEEAAPAEEEVAEEAEPAEEEEAEEAAPAEEKTFWQMIQDGDLDFSGIEINYLYQGGMGYSDEYIPACAEEFEALTGCKVIVDPTPWEAQMPKIVNDVTTGANRYDVFEGDIEFQYGLYAYMEELTPYIEKYNVQMDGYFEPMYTFGEWSGMGRFGLPFSTGISSILIRTDIFDAAGITYPFDSWEDFYAALGEVQDPGNGFYGTSFAGVNAQLVKVWLARYWGQESALYSKTWQPMVNCPEGVKATELMIDYVNYAPPGVMGWDLPEAAAAFLNGDTAAYESWYSMVAGDIDNPERSNILDKWTMIPAPGGGPTGNFTQHNVDLFKASENKDAAFCWMAYVTSEERQMQNAEDAIAGVQRGFDTARKKPFTDVIIPDKPSLTDYVTSLDNGIPMTPGLPQWLEAFMAIGEHCGMAMTGDMTAEEAVEGLEATLKGIIETSIPPYEYVSPYAK